MYSVELISTHAFRQGLVVRTQKLPIQDRSGPESINAHEALVTWLIEFATYVDG